MPTVLCHHRSLCQLVQIGTGFRGHGSTVNRQSIVFKEYKSSHLVVLTLFAPAQYFNQT
ncbi:MAG: hypothetical protein KME11_04250 [Timaviella obliquedivisa GSE-PSE-MK23-08B]|nr:hypothetical protein [Timaviella obliquedivisa GSE-PSE-MK23-08B]